MTRESGLNVNTHHNSWIRRDDCIDRADFWGHFQIEWGYSRRTEDNFLLARRFSRAVIDNS